VVAEGAARLQGTRTDTPGSAQTVRNEKPAVSYQAGYVPVPMPGTVTPPAMLEASWINTLPVPSYIQAGFREVVHHLPLDV